jgi:multiple sugar transport system permease protein
MPAIIFLSVWQGFGYNMLVFSAGLQGIPQQYYEAAAIDGAGHCRASFWF